MSDQQGVAPSAVTPNTQQQAWIRGVIEIDPDFGGGESTQEMPDTPENRALCKRIEHEWVQHVTPIA